MNVRPWISIRQSAQDLSKVDPFRFGPLDIDPPLRCVTSAEQTQHLEPRVMRVLVALTQANGKVLSRDDLISLCWDGQIVGDNAINRVISRIRLLFRQLTDGTVSLETITKVGFRIIIESDFNASQSRFVDAAHDHSQIAKVTRRNLVITTAVAAVVSASGALYWGRERFFTHQPEPLAKDLYDRAQALQKTGEPGSMEQAISFYKQAIDIDPGFADAWGALAIGYYHARDGFSGRKQEAFDRLLRSAADRALALDPDQPDADAALVLSKSVYGRFLAAEAQIHALVNRHPNYWYANARYGITLRELGRFSDSIPYSLKTLEIDQMLPIGWGTLAQAYAYMGDLQRSDQVMRKARERWPSHGFLWSIEYHNLLETGRFGEAAAVAADPRARPDYIPASVGEERASIARALEDGDHTAIKRHRDALAAQSFQNAVNATYLAPTLILLGGVNEAFESLEQAYWQASRNSAIAMEVRTIGLFSPATLTMKDDSRFRQLLIMTGLEEYWKGSGSQPDFRRG